MRTLLEGCLESRGTKIAHADEIITLEGINVRWDAANAISSRVVVSAVLVV